MMIERRNAIESLGYDCKPLLLMAPQQILSWLTFYHKRFQKIDKNYEIIANGDLVI